MNEQPKSDILEAAGCLGSLPNRAGMSFLANQVVAGQIAAGGTTVVFDTESSLEGLDQVQRAMRVGRKRNDGPIASPKAEQPYYRRFDKRR